MKISFTETDITPPIGVRKIGWIRLNVSDELRDPPYARTCIIQSGDSSIAIIQLDTLSIRWTQVNDIRKRVAEQFGFPGERVMVSATHNHAGPAVCSGVDFEREEGYIEEMVVKIVASFGQALDRLEEAELGIGRGMEFDIAHNRRVMMKDGTTKTHGSFSDPNALCFEGPIDPEVFVLSARNKSGDLLGALVNFACHPTHLGDGGVLSAGWPGVFADEMKLKGCMVPMFINGAAGNIHHNNPGRGGQEMSMEEAGQALADRAWARGSATLMSGAARRQSRHLGPVPRSLHLELLAGKSSTTELAAQPEAGVFASEASRGRLDAETGEFFLEMPHGRLLANGQLGARVGPFGVRGRVGDLLEKIRGVGQQPAFGGAGWCAKGGRRMPVWSTTPALLIEGVEVVS